MSHNSLILEAKHSSNEISPTISNLTRNMITNSTHISRTHSLIRHKQDQYETLNAKNKEKSPKNSKISKENKLQQYAVLLEYKSEDKILKIDINPDSIPDNRNSPCRASLFPKDPVTQELCDHKIMLSAYHRLSEFPYKKYEKKRVLTPTHRRKSQNEASGLQFKKMLKRINGEKYSDLSDSLVSDDKFLQQTLKKHEKQVEKGKKIKNEITKINNSFSESRRTSESKNRTFSLENSIKDSYD